MPNYLITDPDSSSPQDPQTQQPQSWMITNASAFINYTHGDPVPSPVLPGMYFSNLQDYPGYSSYKLKYLLDFGSFVEWFTLSGSAVNSGDGTIAFIADGSTIPVQIDFQNLNDLAEGSHLGSVVFELRGINGGNETVLDQRSVYLDFVKAGGGVSGPHTDKNIYKLSYVKSTGHLSGETGISILDNGSSEQLSVEIVQQSEMLKINPSTFTASAAIELGVNGTYFNSLSGIINRTARLKNSTGAVIYNFTVSVAVVEDDEILADPESFEFYAVKSNAETKSATVNITNPGMHSFTVTAPAFITVTPSTEDFQQGTLTIATVNSSTLPIGQQQGNIVITYDGTRTLTIPVKINIVDFVINPYSANGYHFCLDKMLFSMFQINAAALFVRLKIEAKFRTAFGSRTFALEMQTAYFNAVCRMDVGEKVHRWFMKLDRDLLGIPPVSGNFNAVFWMKPAEIKIIAEELNDKFQVLKSQEIPMFKLYPGAKPKMFPLLTNHSVRKRYNESKVIFSYIQGLANQDNFSMMYNNFSALETGDIVAVKTENADGLILWPFKKDFVFGTKTHTVYTDDRLTDVYHIQYRNQNLAPDWATFSGNVKISKNFAHQISENVVNALKQKFETTNVLRLLLDTGFILKKEVAVIDEIIESQSVLVEIEGKKYSGFFTTDKRELDETSELIRYELEFLAVYEN